MLINGSGLAHKLSMYVDLLLICIIGSSTVCILESPTRRTPQTSSLMLCERRCSVRCALVIYMRNEYNYCGFVYMNIWNMAMLLARLKHRLMCVIFHSIVVDYQLCDLLTCEFGELGHKLR